MDQAHDVLALRAPDKDGNFVVEERAQGLACDFLGSVAIA